MDTLLPNLKQLPDIDFSDETHLLALHSVEKADRQIDIEISGAFFSDEKNKKDRI